MTAVSPSAAGRRSQQWWPAVPTPPTPGEWETYLARHGRSFWLATRMIPAPFRTQIAGVYAYCRYTDDLVDHATQPFRELLQVLDEWETLSRVAYHGHATGIELLDVVIGDMGRQGVRFTYVEGLLRGMRKDVAGVRFQTRAQLRDYCHDVASVVGLWLTELCGVHDRWTLERADRLGLAMQLTNIARDIGEDWERGRLYLPQEMLDAHGVTTAMIDRVRRGNDPIPEAFAALLEDCMQWADNEYDAAAAAFKNLPPFFRTSVAVAASVYRGIHGAIRRNGYDSIRRRAYTTDAEKDVARTTALAMLEQSGQA